MSSLVDDAVSSPGDELQEPRNADQKTSNNEVFRKTLHMLPGVVPFILSFLPHDDPPDWIALSIVVLVTAVFTGIYIKMRARVSRPDEDNFYSTVLSYPAAVLGTMLIFPANMEFAMVVVILIAFGDGFAYICGKRFGRKKLPWNPEKSWAGSLGFVAFSAPIAALAFWLEARNPEVPFSLALTCCAIAACAAALAESWPTKITDNLRVGVTAALTVSTSYFLLAQFWV